MVLGVFKTRETTLSVDGKRGRCNSVTGRKEGLSRAEPPILLIGAYPSVLVVLVVVPELDRDMILEMRSQCSLNVHRDFRVL